MSETASLESRDFFDSGLMWKLFIAAVCLAGLSLAVSIGGRLFGHSLAIGDYSDSGEIHTIHVAGNTLLVPENTIRTGAERKDGTLERLDLYLKWPEMSGYDTAFRDAFIFASKEPSLLFLSFKQQIMSRDMSGRFEPIYKSLIVGPGEPGPAGLTVYRFKKDAGYSNETLVRGDAPNGMVFVARCLEKSDLLTACERDILVGDDLSLTYRFPTQFLTQWRAIDLAVRNFSSHLIANGSK